MGKFITDQILGMKWLNTLIGNLLGTLALDVLDKAAFAEGAALAAKAENAAAAALLADAEHKKFAAVKPKRRYDFDF